MLRTSAAFTALYVAWVLAVAIALAATPARAEPAAEGAARAAELNEAGARLYRERQYRQAIEKFIEAYSIDRDANLLFNIARCYEELGDNGAAIEKYNAYVNAPGADAAGRLRAEQSLRALRALQRRPPAPEAKPIPDAKPVVDERAAAPDADGSSLQRTLAWSALGAGVLLAGVGGTLFYLGTLDHDRVRSSPGYGDPMAVNPMTMSEAGALVDAGDWKKLAGGIGLGVGGALLATSVALFVLPGEREGSTRARSMAFGCVPTTGGVRAAFTVRF